MTEIWKTMAQGLFFKWRRINLKTKKVEIKLVQLGVRPSIFGCYELIFPEEALSELLSVLGVGDEHSWPLIGGMKGLALRKMFGCKKIPKKNLKEALKIPNTIVVNGSERGLSNLKVDGVAHHIIGIKYDLRHDCKEWGYNQEMLQLSS